MLYRNILKSTRTFQQQLKSKAENQAQIQMHLNVFLKKFNVSDFITPKNLDTLYPIAKR
jgi:hypothetical protein